MEQQRLGDAGAGAGVVEVPGAGMQLKGTNRYVYITLLFATWRPGVGEPELLQGLRLLSGSSVSSVTTTEFKH